MSRFPFEIVYIDEGKKPYIIGGLKMPLFDELDKKLQDMIIYILYALVFIVACLTFAWLVGNIKDWMGK